ncbi:hypothetical protein [Limnoglobus roseus]|uniref:Uncharacterized protein n=1 Tax=Limnoglobus roseus TaxID=2598579 RepID=A0A5C1AQ22_9BACT|nr:hypothetical protein [Limnoglobus roseus]QEL20705.1 hypothetical protein PX52LOC_07814 [Limnoglobus roseus]
MTRWCRSFFDEQSAYVLASEIRKVDVQIGITHNGVELPGDEIITTTIKDGGEGRWRNCPRP